MSCGPWISLTTTHWLATNKSAWYHNESNYSIIRTPPFPGKMIKYCIPSIRTSTFEIIIPVSTPCRARTGVVERLLAFNSLCGATARVTEHLLAYYRCFRMSTRLLQLFPNIYWTPTVLLWSLNRGCQMCTSLWQSLQSSNEGCQMCNSLGQSLRSSNGA